MTTDGWIQRRESPSDRRVKTVHMTAKARRTVERIETIAGQLRAELFADIPRTELLACLDVLKRLKQKAENA
jgi:MarR family transcriptional regulator for hemolysin